MTIGGSTPSEIYLSKLCQKSFLSLWSFPNVFNNNGIKNGKGVGKEICDLLVVFGNDVIIFSDKSCRYKETGKLSVDWNRWYKKSIIKSANQLYGAERWIRSFPDRVFLDPECKNAFPFKLPSPDKIRIHRIAVALGAKEHCIKFYNGGSGSLRISTGLIPVMKDDTERIKAFTIGDSESGKAYVHIFDDVTLDIIIQELDTINDFCTYLKKRESLADNTTVGAGGEEELLGLYLQTMESDKNHGFGIPSQESAILMVPEGEWARLCNNPQYIAKKDADKNSYIWDRLIEHFNMARSKEKLRDDVHIHDHEKSMRKMATLSRIERRMVGTRIKEIFKTTPPNATRYSAVVMGGANGKMVFAFVLFPPDKDKTYDEYLAVRRELLLAYCNILKLKHSKIEEIIGLALEPHQSGRGGSEDLMYLNYSDWSDESKKQAEKDAKALGIKAKANLFSEQEYPEIKPQYTGSRKERRKAAKLAKKNNKGT